MKCEMEREWGKEEPGERMRMKMPSIRHPQSSSGWPSSLSFSFSSLFILFLHRSSLPDAFRPFPLSFFIPLVFFSIKLLFLMVIIHDHFEEPGMILFARFILFDFCFSSFVKTPEIDALVFFRKRMVTGRWKDKHIGTDLSFLWKQQFES